MLPTPVTSRPFISTCLIAARRPRVMREQIIGVERRVERLGRQMSQQPVLRRVLEGVVQAAEAARIVEAQGQPESSTRSN